MSTVQAERWKREKEKEKGEKEKEDDVQSRKSGRAPTYFLPQRSISSDGNKEYDGKFLRTHRAPYDKESGETGQNSSSGDGYNDKQ